MWHKAKNKTTTRLLKRIGGILALGAIAGMLVLLAFIFIAVPDLNNFSERKIVESTKIYDRTGTVLLYDIHGEEKRTIIPFNEIPRSVKNATIAHEDDTFYQHRGIRPISMIRALFANLKQGGVTQGVSTITQQVIKKTILTDERTLTRKIKEIILALKIERVYSKDEILNVYLNQIPYGSSAYGIEAAAQTFFGKSARDLTLVESSYLAALPNAPSFYSPCGKNRDKLDNRAHLALERMLNLSFISQQEFDQAKKESVQFKTSCYQGIIAPHFVIEIRDQLNTQFGEDAVEQRGFKVITTLDADLQKKSEEIVAQFSETIAKISPVLGSIL